jgi:hypothetical protein
MSDDDNDMDFEMDADRATQVIDTADVDAADPLQIDEQRNDTILKPLYTAIKAQDLVCHGLL